MSSKCGKDNPNWNGGRWEATVTRAYWDLPWNVTTGCSHSGSPGCDRCWARKLHERFGDGDFSEVKLHPERLEQPIHRRKPKVVFVCNTSDLFHPAVPFKFVAEVYHTMVGEASADAPPDHQYLVLTKRPERRLEFIEWAKKGGDGSPVCDAMAAYFNYSRPHPRVWEGTTVENQARANERIPLLLKTFAARRWLSLEPLLGPIDFLECFPYIRQAGAGTRHIDQVIVGAEMGTSSRLCEAEWIREILRACREAKVPAFLKQVGSRFSDPVNGVAGKLLEVHPDAPPPTRRLLSRHGRDPEDWPPDLRVRQLAWRQDHA